MNPFVNNRTSPRPKFSKEEYGKWVSSHLTKRQTPSFRMSTQIDLFVYCFSSENISVHRPIAGSLTEARGQRANIHVFKEMLELCEIINSEGFSHCKETPKLKVILFGELFNVRHGKHNLNPFYKLTDSILSNRFTRASTINWWDCCYEHANTNLLILKEVCNYNSNN